MLKNLFSYLLQIRNDEVTTVTFTATQQEVADYLSPAVIKVYDYYNKGKHLDSQYKNYQSRKNFFLLSCCDLGIPDTHLSNQLID